MGINFVSTIYIILIVPVYGENTQNVTVKNKYNVSKHIIVHINSIVIST